MRAWHKLHFKKLADLIGTLVQVEFLKEDGTSRYKRPMWLFWTGLQSVALPDLCRMYLWRFAIEHMFRFLKQHMGLNRNRSPNLVSAQQWMWLCALAYWQLLLMGDVVKEDYPAWYPRSKAPISPEPWQASTSRSKRCFSAAVNRLRLALATTSVFGISSFTLQLESCDMLFLHRLLL